MNLIVNGKEKYIPDISIQQIEQDFGDMDILWNWCGSIGQCEECKKKSTKDNRVTCGKHYKVGTIRSESIIIITLKNGKQIMGSEITGHCKSI